MSFRSLIIFKLFIIVVIVSLSSCAIETGISPAVDNNNIQHDSGNTTADGKNEFDSSNDFLRDSAGSHKSSFPYNPNDSHAFYVYLCVSDLEALAGCATQDIDDLLSANLPPNVTVVIEVGGGPIDYKLFGQSLSSGRIVHNRNRAFKAMDLPVRNMGDSTNFADFLKYCTTNYPANHQNLIFWDHGGGSLSGVCFDVNFNDDSLSLKEIKDGLLLAFGEPNRVNPPLDVVYFDACLMQTIETASSLYGYAGYMVGAEDVSWTLPNDYSSLLSSMDEYTDAKDMADRILTNYWNNAQLHNLTNVTTISLIDIGNIELLNRRYYQFCAAAIEKIIEDKASATKIRRAASLSQQIGVGSPIYCFNLIDMKDFVEKLSLLLPDESSRLIEAIDSTVIRFFAGSKIGNYHGISTYFPVGNDKSRQHQELSIFREFSDNYPCELFIKYILEGTLTPNELSEVRNYLYNSDTDGFETPYEPGFTVEPDNGVSGSGDKKPPKIDGSIDLENYPIKVYSDQKTTLIDLGKDNADKITKVSTRIREKLSDGTVILLGAGALYRPNWESGRFKSTFDGRWTFLCGYKLSATLVENDEYYSSYVSPILLNGETMSMKFVYDKQLDKCFIVGLSHISDNKFSDGVIRNLKKGDVISTLFYSDYNNNTLTPLDSFVYDGVSTIQWQFFREGDFLINFQMEDVRGNTYNSQAYRVIISESGVSYSGE